MTAPAFDTIHWYMSDIGAQLVAKTGIPTDIYHLGKLFLDSVNRGPDFVVQIDGATGESETNSSFVKRTIKCAIALTNLGLEKGDAVMLTGPNHLNYGVPHNAGLCLGVMVGSIDANLVVYELKDIFQISRPKIIFCQSKKSGEIAEALSQANVNAKIITFDDDYKYTTLTQLLETVDDEAVKTFKPTDFDPEDTVAYLTSTSGTTGTPKSAMLTHKNVAIAAPYGWYNFTKFPNPTRLALALAPAQWLSTTLHLTFCSIVHYTRLQTSAPASIEHFADLVNKYKPSHMVISPNMMSAVLQKAKCDFSCFKYIILGGNYSPAALILAAKKAAYNALVVDLYGLTETSGTIAQHYDPIPGSCGRPIGCVEIKIVDTTTGEIITQPNVTGELWFRGPTIFKGYHNKPEITKETLLEGGWMKSGDIFYRDEAWNLFFVDRCKLLMKYRVNQISPTEVENLIMTHPGVSYVAVSGIPDEEVGDLIVACVVRKPGSTNPTAQEIKDLVKDNMSDAKQLRGGVIFMSELPTTNTGKIDRNKLKKLVISMPKE